MTIYLDWNATTPRHPDVVLAMEQAECSAWGNPSSVHGAGREARRYLEDAREAVAALLRLSARDVLFTSGGTEANHLALSGAKYLVTSRIEHPSVALQARHLNQSGAKVVFAEVESSGVVSPEAIAEALDTVLDGVSVPELDQDAGGINNQNTPLVAVMAVNHETGVLQPIEAIADAVHARRARLHVDAVQLIGKGDLSPLGAADSVAITPHKFRGPKGIGVLGFNCGWTPTPIGRGGAQERGLRAGTVDGVAAAGLLAAVRRMDALRVGYRRAGELGQFLEAQLTQRAAQPLVIHGADVARLSHVVNFRTESWKGDELVAALDLEGICVSSGSACSAGTAEPSTVINEMLGRDAAVGAVRVSLGEDTTSEHVNQLLAALERLGVLVPAEA